jgi:translation elongation factor EF-4
MVIHIMNEPVDALSFMVHKDRAFPYAKQICKKLKDTIPQQLFVVAIQAKIGSKVIAREDIPYVKKDVTAKCYGGDYSRKRKLLERYKEGKKKLRSIGKVQVGKETFLHILKQ